MYVVNFRILNLCDVWDNYVNVKMIFFLFILSVFFKKLEFFFWFYLIGEVLFIIKKFLEKIILCGKIIKIF